MDKDRFKFILGSKSPRRKELIDWLDIPFTLAVSDAPEVSDYEDPVLFCEDIATQKSEVIWEALDTDENYFVVASDTIVCLGNRIYGKPKDMAGAKQMLSDLSGRIHEVITSVSMRNRKKKHVFSVSSKVTFDIIDDETMDLYLGSGESLDKAGSYGIQGKGLIFISSLEGSYSNVVGFPLSDFVRELRVFLNVEENENWRALFV